MAKKIVLNGVLFLTLSLGLCFAQENKNVSAEEQEYRIGVNDILEISVYKEPDLTKTVRVAADGVIAFPLLGSVHAKGLTAKGLQNRLTELLGARFLVNPQVSVFIKIHAKVFILGQVRTPGEYELGAALTVLKAITLAGGFTEKADTEKVKLVRTRGEGKETFILNINEMMESNVKAKDVPLEGGDLIVVEERPIDQQQEESKFIVVLGQVVRPGRYVYKDGMTIIDAIALAGSFTPTAAPEATKIIRVQEGGKNIIRVPLKSILAGVDKTQDITLEPNDTIMVPESFF